MGVRKASISFRGQPPDLGWPPNATRFTGRFHKTIAHELEKLLAGIFRSGAKLLTYFRRDQRAVALQRI